jgi:pimeloyl-ACP methyl ester carboxylesterase
MPRALVLLLSFHLCFAALAQKAGPERTDPLQRKAWLGMRPLALTDSLRQVAGCTGCEGAYIAEVRPASTAAVLELRAGDVLTAINGRPISGPGSLAPAVAEALAGDAVTIAYIRSGRMRTAKGRFVGRAYETDPHAEVIYDAVPFRGGRLRAIINKPRQAGRMKALLFIPGYTCTSQDGWSADHPYARIVHAFSKAGYVVLRVEKTGLGDSEGTPPCEDCDLYGEVESFTAGLRKLKSLPYVDSTQVFIFGHSMGGVVGPMIAATERVKGLMVYGTTAKSWYEYQIEMNRLQGMLAKPDPMAFEADCRTQAGLAYEYYIRKRSLADIATDPRSDTLLRTYWEWDGGSRIFSRNQEYWRQIQDVDLLGAWRDAATRVLVLFGGTDFQAFSRADHEQIVYTVNHHAPGTATLRVFPGTDHFMAVTGTMQESYDLFTRGEIPKLFELFDHEVPKAAVEWAEGL